MEAEAHHLVNFKSWIKHFPMTPVLIVDGEIRHRGKLLLNKKSSLVNLDLGHPRDNRGSHVV